MRDWSPKTRPPPLATTHTRTFARTCTHTHAHVCSHTRIHTHTPQLREKRYGDFPRVRVLLDPQHYSFPSRRTTSSTDRHTPSQTETAQNRKRKALSVARTVQKIFLISPLAVLLSLSLLLLMSGLLNDGARVTSGGEGGGDCWWMKWWEPHFFCVWLDSFPPRFTCESSCAGIWKIISMYRLVQTPQVLVSYLCRLIFPKRPVIGG